LCFLAIIIMTDSVDFYLQKHRESPIVCSVVAWQLITVLVVPLVGDGWKCIFFCKTWLKMYVRHCHSWLEIDGWKCMCHLGSAWDHSGKLYVLQFHSWLKIQQCNLLPLMKNDVECKNTDCKLILFLHENLYIIFWTLRYTCVLLEKRVTHVYVWDLYTNNNAHDVFYRPRLINHKTCARANK
jgi:hypothetical protein